LIRHLQTGSNSVKMDELTLLFVLHKMLLITELGEG